MTELFFKYNPKVEDINDVNVKKMLTGRCINGRVRVIVRDGNFNCPPVQYAEFDNGGREPWKSEYWLEASTTWEGLFVPDSTWEKVTLDN